MIYVQYQHSYLSVVKLINCGYVIIFIYKKLDHSDSCVVEHTPCSLRMNLLRLGN